MATTFTWSIDGLRVAQAPGPDFVTSVNWTCSGTDGVNTAVIDSTSEFEPVLGPNPQIPFANLTPVIVQGWVNAELGQNGIDGAEAAVQGQLDSLATPPQAPTSKPGPWL